MAEVVVKVPSKVNLALLVGETDPEGYHRLGTVFQAVSLHDEVRARSAEPGCFRLTFRGEGASFLPVDGTNLVTRAARLLAETHRVRDAGVDFLVHKHIPVAGGMAGGSADAAAALVACNELWGLGLRTDDLHPLAAQLGSDVPFLLHGGTAIGTGRGEQLRPLRTTGTHHWVLALSHSGLSTPAVFKEFDRTTSPRPTQVAPELLTALEQGDVAGVAQLLTNDLAAAALSLQPDLAEVIRIGMGAGALGSVVSGSGPTIAFLCDSEALSLQVGEALRVSSRVRAVRRAVGPVPGARIE
ncbi:MAG: 4-(cytidine 5'-diphospho)-2-C-methyl-D-erythritol kinase [Arachnia propionica]|uniref:4-(cytidine 5'-diphospho)-2-C-methyl-D-erythritol kinase n=1 Tax=Arachnia propionica TaxID=1750 RepID=UPI0026FEFA9C|nr:4-(cytidine 5'-diphospho)-2-C-methyl-D-erythritol kinase [Arachnia propionica]